MQPITFSYRSHRAALGSDTAVILRDQLYELSIEVREAMALGLVIEKALAQEGAESVRITLDYEWAGYLRHATDAMREQLPAMRTNVEVLALTALVTPGLA
jgi:hypothetical protein